MSLRSTYRSFALHSRAFILQTGCLKHAALICSMQAAKLAPQSVIHAFIFAACKATQEALKGPLLSSPFCLLSSTIVPLLAYPQKFRHSSHRAQRLSSQQRCLGPCRKAASLPQYSAPSTYWQVVL